MNVTMPDSRGGPVPVLYTAFAGATFLACLSVAFVGATLLPGVARRRRWVSAFARLFFSLAGIPVDVRGLDRLPEGRAIVVANHASYFDGVILQAFLPPRFAYVIKSEMRNVPLGGFLLRRIGSRFVERFVTSASARDARVLVRAASNGEALGFFPEGTFRPEPGIRRFRDGAFLTAVKAAVPVVPVAILGSRELLPSGSWLLRRAALTVDVQAPILPDDAAFGQVRGLAEEARRRILQAVDEPDLLCEV